MTAPAGSIVVHWHTGGTFTAVPHAGDRGAAQLAGITPDMPDAYVSFMAWRCARRAGLLDRYTPPAGEESEPWLAWCSLVDHFALSPRTQPTLEDVPAPFGRPPE